MFLPNINAGLAFLASILSGSFQSLNKVDFAVSRLNHNFHPRTFFLAKSVLLLIPSYLQPKYEPRYEKPCFILVQHRCMISIRFRAVWSVSFRCSLMSLVPKSEYLSSCEAEHERLSIT